MCLLWNVLVAAPKGEYNDSLPVVRISVKTVINSIPRKITGPILTDDTFKQ